MTVGPAVGATPRTRARRLPERAVTELRAAHAVLDAGLVAHVAVLDEDGQPYVLPVAYARDGDRVLFHGSTGSRLFRSLGAGVPTCLTVTLLDGLVLARSAFESSMNYRSVMVLGTCRQLAGSAADNALRVISDHLLPDRWDDIRPPSRKELAATVVLSLDLGECSVKIRDGGPDDLPEDLDRPGWAGHLPMIESFGAPVPADANAAAFPVPPYVKEWSR